mgnify:FL=1|jgi:hypothetical protein
MIAMAVWIIGGLFTCGATDAPVSRYLFLVIAWPLFLGMAVRDALRVCKSNPSLLERRCRNAEKLLDECRSIMAANGLYPSTQKRVSAHLAAAAQEDGK